MEIKVYVANLGKYNEGILKGEWFTLPHDIEDIYTTIGVGQFDNEGNYIHGVEEDGIYYEEYAIHDYEAPFSINEYESLNKLNEIAVQLENVTAPDPNNYGQYNVNDVINFAHELENEGLINDASYHVGDIISNEELDEHVKSMSENGDGWERIKYFLSNADMNNDYHIIDGYANIDRLTDDHLKNIMSDLLTELKSSL